MNKADRKHFRSGETFRRVTQVTDANRYNKTLIIKISTVIHVHPYPNCLTNTGN